MRERPPPALGGRPAARSPRCFCCSALRDRPPAASTGPPSTRSLPVRPPTAPPTIREPWHEHVCPDRATEHLTRTDLPGTLDPTSFVVSPRHRFEPQPVLDD